MNGREYPAFTADNAPKAGDKVIMIGNGQDPERVLTVKKVTPTGLVKTEEGLVYKEVDSGIYTQKGSGWIYTERFVFTSIVPYTPELAERVEEFRRKQEEEAARHETIEAAKQACRVMASVEKALPYDIAVRILEVYAAYKEERI